MNWGFFVELILGGYILYSIIILSVYLLASSKVWFSYKKPNESNYLIDKNPKVSIVIPAYNEEVFIVDSIKSILKQDYNNIDIIIVNDGSIDNTSRLIIESFNLTSSDLNIDNKLNESLFYYATVESIYKKDNITLINSLNGGKSSALNIGTVYSDSEFILTVDADTILSKNAISRTLKCLRPDSDAASCFIGVINDNPEMKNEVPKKLLPKIQWIEYTRSFILWRLANDKQNATLVMPGAYSFMRRDAIIKSGGYKFGSLSEDMEVTMSMIKNGCKIQFIPEFLAWTEVPEKVKFLTKQRLRWYRGGLQNLIKFKGMLFNIKYPVFVSFYMLPFLWFADVFGIWVEVWSIINAMIMFFFRVPINTDLLKISWIVIAILYYTFMISLSLFIKIKLGVKKVHRIFIVVLFEIFTYHFFNLWWMLESHSNQYLGTDKKWNKFNRVGLKNDILD